MGYTCDVFRCGICCKELFNIEDYARHMVLQEQCHVVLSPCDILHDLLLPRFKPTGERCGKLGNSTQTDQEISEESATAVKVLTGESPSDVRWKCQLCNLTFSRRAALANHSALVHGSPLLPKQGPVKDVLPKCKKPKLERLVHSNIVIENTENSKQSDFVDVQTKTVSKSWLDSNSSLLPKLHSENNFEHSLDNNSNDERGQACGASCTKIVSSDQSQYSNELQDSNGAYISDTYQGKRKADFIEPIERNTFTYSGPIADVKSIVLSQEAYLEDANPAIHISPDSSSLQLESKPLVTLKVSDEFPTKDISQTNSSEVQVVPDDDDDPELLQEAWENNAIIDLEKPQNVIVLDLHEENEKDDDIISIYELNVLSCKHCSETFKTSRTLQQHLSIVHATHKPFVCAFQDCGQAFKTKGSLTRHHRRHTGERPYVCGVCGRSFRESGTLHRHRQSKVSCANKTDSQLTRYRAALPLPHADSKACVAKLLLKKEEVLCGEDSRGATASAKPDNSTLLTAAVSTFSAAVDNTAPAAGDGAGDSSCRDQQQTDDQHQKPPVTFAAGRVIKQERIEAKHQQASSAAPEAEGRPQQWGEGGHKSKQHLSLLSIKQEAGGRLQLQQPTKPRCKLECPEPEPSPSDDEEAQWEEPESPSSLSHPPDSPGSVTSLNPSLVDVPPYPMFQFASDNRFGDCGPWEDEAEGDGVQSPSDSRDIKPRLAFTDIKPRINSATPDIKPRFQHTSLQEAAPPHVPGHLPPQDALVADDTTRSAVAGDGVHSASDALLFATPQTDGCSVNCPDTAASGHYPVNFSDNAVAVQTTNSHTSLAPVCRSKVECGSIFSSVDHINPVPDVYAAEVSTNQTMEYSGFPEGVLKPPGIAVYSHILGAPVKSSIVVSESSGLPLSEFSSCKGSVLADPSSSGDTSKAANLPHASTFPSTSMTIPALPDAPGDHPNLVAEDGTARAPTPAVLAPTTAAHPAPAIAPQHPPPDATAAEAGSSEPLKVVFNCPHCDRSFDARSSLMTHLYTHYNKLGPQCSECNKSFTSRQGVVRHLVRHASVRRFVCTQCAQHFSHPSQLLQHRLSHSQHKPVLCNVCGRSFKTVSSRNLHARAAHAGAREECGVCGRMFTTRGSLQRHQRTHSGARPYACRHCATAFRDQGTLARHLRYKKPCCILDKNPPNSEPKQVALTDVASVIDEEHHQELDTDIDDTELSDTELASSVRSVPLNEQLLAECSQLERGNRNSCIGVAQQLDNPATHEIILDLNNSLEEGHLVVETGHLGSTVDAGQRARQRQIPLVVPEDDDSAEEEQQVNLQNSTMLGEHILEYIFEPNSADNNVQGREFEIIQEDLEPEAGEPETVVYIQAFK